MAGYPNGQFLPSPSSHYSPRTPPPQRVNIPPAASYVPPSSSPYPVGGLQGTLTTVSKEVLKGLTKVGSKALNKVLDHPTLVNIKSGNVVLFISRVTGQSLQILQAPDGHLVLDSMGGDGHQFHNAHFTVVQDKDGYFMLHNNFNFLAIKDGTAQLYAAGPGGLPTPECRFKIKEVLMQNQFVTIESVSERGRYFAVMPNGQMKSAIATSGADQDTHFAVRLIEDALNDTEEDSKDNKKPIDIIYPQITFDGHLLPLLKYKRKHSPDHKEEACAIMKHVCKRDELFTYGEHVANELRCLNKHSQTIAKHLINNVLFEAAIGKFNNEDYTITTSTPVKNFETTRDDDSSSELNFSQCKY